MRLVILFVAVLVGTAISLNAQTAPDAAQLTKLLNDFLAGAGRNDPAAHDRFWASDLIYTRSAGMRTNKEELMKGVRSAPPRKEGDPVTVFTAEDVRIQQYGNAAVVAFKLVSTTTKADGTKIVANNLNTGTFINRVSGNGRLSPGNRRPFQSRNQSHFRLSPRCYYLNQAGSKVYVDKKFCT